MQSELFFMEPLEQEGGRKHVIQKIKRISLALDKRDYWNYLILAAVCGIMLAFIIYLFF